MEHLGELAAIWRYPVKSLASQRLEHAVIASDGIPGDRERALIVREGHARIAKAYRGKEHNLLHTVESAASAVSLARARGVAVTLADEQPHYFDDAPLSLIFDCWIADVERALGTALDPLRWRPNLYARATPEFTFAEAQLVGRAIAVGSTLLRVRNSIERCVTTTYDQATGESNPQVLRYVAQCRQKALGVYCVVELAGEVRCGDALRLRTR